MALRRERLDLDFECVVLRRFLGDTLNGRLFLTAHSISMILVSEVEVKNTNASGQSDEGPDKKTGYGGTDLSRSLTLSGTYDSALRYRLSATSRLFLGRRDVSAEEQTVSFGENG